MKLNFDILHNILNSDNIEHKQILYFSLINSLKNNIDLYQYVDINYIENTLQNVELIENIYDSADVIHFILRVIYQNKFQIERNKIEKLFYLYCKNLENGYYIREEMQDTFLLFVHLGIQPNSIIAECMKLYNIDDCIHLFLKLNFQLKEKEMNHCIQQHRKLMIRFDLILHFYLMTSLEYAENIVIAGDYLNKYYNYMVICADWAFSSECYDDTLVQQNIITQKELELFIELGDLLNRYKQSQSSVDIEGELFEFLNIMTEQFKLFLTSDEIKEIRKCFMNGKDLFEIAFCLPDDNTIKEK